MKKSMRAWVALASIGCLHAQGATRLQVIEAGQTLIDQAYSESDTDFSGFQAVGGSMNLAYSGTPQWRIELHGTPSSPLLPACYERAKSSFVDAGRASLVFTLNGLNGTECNQSSARFRLLSFETDGAQNVTSLAVDFVQQCEDPRAATFGKLRYRSDVPFDTPLMEPVFSTQGMLHFASDDGDFVGDGQEASIDFDDASLRAGSSGTQFGASSSAFIIPYWLFSISAPDTSPLVVGTYTDAQRDGFQATGHAGLNFSYDGRGCNELDGSFTVLEFARDRIDGVPTRMHAMFEQHCEHAVPALRGEFDLTTTFENGPFVDDVVFGDHFDGGVVWPLVWACPMP